MSYLTDPTSSVPDHARDPFCAKGTHKSLAVPDGDISMVVASTNFILNIIRIVLTLVLHRLQ